MTPIIYEPDSEKLDIQSWTDFIENKWDGTIKDVTPRPEASLSVEWNGLLHSATAVMSIRSGGVFATFYATGVSVNGPYPAFPGPAWQPLEGDTEEALALFESDQHSPQEHQQQPDDEQK